MRLVIDCSLSYFLSNLRNHSCTPFSTRISPVFHNVSFTKMLYACKVFIHYLLQYFLSFFLSLFLSFFPLLHFILFRLIFFFFLSFFLSVFPSFITFYFISFYYFYLFIYLFIYCFLHIWYEYFEYIRNIACIESKESIGLDD